MHGTTCGWPTPDSPEIRIDAGLDSWESHPMLITDHVQPQPMSSGVRRTGGGASWVRIALTAVFAA
jgi:hypothetical protein